MENKAERFEIGFHTVQRDTKTILSECVLLDSDPTKGFAILERCVIHL